MQSAAERAKAQEAKRKKEAFKVKPRTGAAADIGKFEQHTKGFGQKMLERMGYKAGQGLGAQGQGISRPVEAKLRPQKAGLGAGGHTEHKLSLETEQPKAEPKVCTTCLWHIWLEWQPLAVTLVGCLVSCILITVDVKQ